MRVGKEPEVECITSKGRGEGIRREESLRGLSK